MMSSFLIHEPNSIEEQWHCFITNDRSYVSITILQLLLRLCLERELCYACLLSVASTGAVLCSFCLVIQFCVFLFNIAVFFQIRQLIDPSMYWFSIPNIGSVLKGLSQVCQIFCLTLWRIVLQMITLLEIMSMMVFISCFS